MAPEKECPLCASRNVSFSERDHGLVCRDCGSVITGKPVVLPPPKEEVVREIIPDLSRKPRAVAKVAVKKAKKVKKVVKKTVAKKAKKAVKKAKKVVKKTVAKKVVKKVKKASKPVKKKSFMNRFMRR